jgi:hypothetical protein
MRLRGYLIEASGKDGCIWRGSLARDDIGNGSCEAMFLWSAETRSLACSHFRTPS